ncbi:hypothetical protein [Xylophilus sp. GOD-11R]|uniref:hypothetical protein n=1 Tax=Xylophilus sp. GOD-11R TaxID=3089814 RepID=UPI00298BD5A0|nr:hypothetical protein [Xylophilus sp. GOD-11R]WPB59301.1 hypothetical protein R9X41_11915 [Xylophilus sp. GOD-11R]
MAHRRLQAGFGTIDSLIALLVLSLGLLGVARLMTRQLVDTRGTSQRAHALQYIAAIDDSMALHRPAPRADGSLEWDDLNNLRHGLRSAMPGADATVFQSDTDARQVGIAITWPANQRWIPVAEAALDAAPFAVTLANSGFDCPTRRLCQVSYVSR